MAKMSPDVPDSRHQEAGAIRGVIELLGRSGLLLQRLPYHGNTIKIGRAYDNDIIVSDPYVCPHHLVIQEHDGGSVGA